jgi:hypothetical protein
MSAEGTNPINQPNWETVMELLNHHLQFLKDKGINNPKTSIGSNPYYVHWESESRWGHLYLDTCRVTEFKEYLGRHTTL